MRGRQISTAGLLSLGIACVRGGADLRPSNDTPVAPPAETVTPDDTPWREDEDVDPPGLGDLTEPAVGDLSCFDPTGDWGAQQVDPSCTTPGAGSGVLFDADAGTPVAGARLELYTADRIDGAPQAVLTTDAEGRIGGADVPPCVSFALRITTPDQVTQPTCYFHWTEGPAYPVEITAAAVSAASYQRLTTEFGQPDPSQQGIVAGLARDCLGEGSPIRHVRVVARREGSGYPRGQRSWYNADTGEGGPVVQGRGAIDPDARATATDGWYHLTGLAPGPYVLEAWGVVGAGAPQRLGAARVEVFAGTVSVADVYAGDDDGAYFAPECLTPCAGPPG